MKVLLVSLKIWWVISSPVCSSFSIWRKSGMRFSGLGIHQFVQDFGNRHQVGGSLFEHGIEFPVFGNEELNETVGRHEVWKLNGAK